MKMTPIVSLLRKSPPLLVASLDGDDLPYLLEQARSEHADMAEIRGMLQGIGDGARVGMCFDTAHAFAAGLPIHTEDGLRDTVRVVDDQIGWDRVPLIHLNDSKVPFHAKVDRHWHIGQGHIGLDGFQRLLNHPQFAARPWILETPGETDADDLRNLRTVLRLIAP